MESFRLTHVAVVTLILMCSCNAQDPTPLKKIKGPTSLNDDIAIIGEDTAAIHMAYLLQTLGFDPVIYLSSKRPGIDVRSIFHPIGIPHEVSNSYIWSHFTELKNIINQLNLQKVIDLPPSKIWRTDAHQFSAFGFTGEMLATHDKKQYTLSSARTRMKSLLNSYKALHQKIFGTYDHMLPPRPHENYTDTLNTTIKDFLIENNLEPLQTVFNILFTAQGFGQLDEVPALYGLIYITPRFIDKFMISVDYPNTPMVSLLNIGLEIIWSELIRRYNLNTKYYHRIYKVVPGVDENNSVTNHTLYYKKPNGKKYKRTFDFVVMSNNLKYKIQKLFKNATDEELKTFNDVDYLYGVTSVVDSVFNSTNKCLYREYFFQEILDNNHDTDVYAYRDMEQAMEGGTCQLMDEYNNTIVHSGTFIQSTATKPTHLKSTESLKNFFKRYEIDAEIIERKAFRIAPKFSMEDTANGRLHDIWDMQGQHGKWYIGPQASFDSLESTMQYNQQLVANFDVPT